MIKNKKVLCVIQARTGSTRLPRKILKKIGGIPLLSHVIRRVKLSEKIDKVLVATTNLPEDDVIAVLAEKEGVWHFRGSVDDVLDRYYQASLNHPEYEVIVRVTGDCPIIDPQVIDQVLDFFGSKDYDYASNVLEETYPDGMDTEVFKKEVLSESWRLAKLKSEREHVTLHIRNNPKYEKGNLRAKENFSHFRFTVDNPEDFEVIKFIIENTSLESSYLDYIKFISKHPKIMKKNMHIKRNEGLAKSLKEDKIKK